MAKRASFQRWAIQAAAVAHESDNTVVALEHCYHRCLHGHLRAWRHVTKKRRVVRRCAELLRRGQGVASVAWGMRLWRRQVAKVREATLRKHRIKVGLRGDGESCNGECSCEASWPKFVTKSALASRRLCPQTVVRSAALVVCCRGHLGFVSTVAVFASRCASLLENGDPNAGFGPWIPASGREKGGNTPSAACDGGTAAFAATRTA